METQPYAQCVLGKWANSRPLLRHLTGTISRIDWYRCPKKNLRERDGISGCLSLCCRNIAPLDFYPFHSARPKRLVALQDTALHCCVLLPLKWHCMLHANEVFPPIPINPVMKFDMRAMLECATGVFFMFTVVTVRVVTI